MKNYILLFLFIINPFFVFSQKKDSLFINFPEKYHLVLKNNQENSVQVLREWIPNGQNWEDYDIIATTIVLKNGKNISLYKYRDLLVKDLKERTKGFKYTLLDENKDENNGYLIFKCEADSYKGTKDKESQIYYLVKGKNDLFGNIIALRTDKLPEEFVEEWRTIFKESKFVE